MFETYVPISYVIHLLEQARDAGCDIESILSHVGLNQHELSNRKDLSAKCYGEIYRLIMRETQDEWFGMISDGRVPLGSFRMLGLTILQCSDLRQAIFRASDFMEICRGMAARFYLNIEGETAIISLAPLRSSCEEKFESILSKTKPEKVFTLMLTWHRFLEWLIGKPLSLSAMHLMFDADQASAPNAYSNLDEITFSAQVNSFSFSVEYLNYPIVQSADALAAFLRTAPYHLVTQDTARIGPAEKVRSILNRDVSGNMPSADAVASMLYVSATTLRRQLQAEGTSFQKIKDNCRLEAAYHYLSYAELSNIDVADKLGFDEPSAFFRSFKKWTGLTPGEYRKTLK